MQAFESHRDWERCLIKQDATIRDAIKALDMNGFQFGIVTDINGVILGTITDGDIRRGVLKGYNLDENVSTIFNENFLSVKTGISQLEARKIMTTNLIAHLPIQDESKRIVGVHFLREDKEVEGKDNLFVVMAGGKGTRLFPQTENCPKPMLYVGEKPMLEHVLDHAIEEGFSKFIFSIGHLGHMIQEYFGDGSTYGVEIQYIQEEKPLGTAGSLGLLYDYPDSPVLISNADVLSDISYSRIISFHEKHSASATLAVKLNEWQNPFGVVQIDGIDVIGYEEKPVLRSHSNAGVYVIQGNLLKRIKQRAYLDMPNFLESLRLDGEKVIAYGLHEQWLDVGRPTEFAEAQDLLKKKPISADKVRNIYD